MKTIVNKKAVVNWKLLSLLFALSVVLHVIASVTSPSHPLLSVSLVLLESIGWSCIGLIWVIALIKGIQQWGPKAWTKVWRGVRMHRRAKKAKTHDTFIPVKQLKYLRNDVQRLGLALHGMTSEMENARRMYFQMLGEAVPPLILPPQNALLYAEFESLVKVLNHLGFHFWRAYGSSRGILPSSNNGEVTWKPSCSNGTKTLSNSKLLCA